MNCQLQKLSLFRTLRTFGTALLFVLFIQLVATAQVPQVAEPAQVDQQAAQELSAYPIRPVDIRNVKVTDQFWLPIIKRVQEKTFDFAIEKLKQEGRLENFLIAGGQKSGTVKGQMPFDDSDVYKIIEGASNSLISVPNPNLEALLDRLIRTISVGQESDGYLTTWRTIDPRKPPASWVKVIKGERWESLDMSHELYNAGHLYEAAAVHFKATGKTNFLDIATKNADLMVQTFGESEGQIQAVPGHQIIETGLIMLYRATGTQAYFDLAKYFLDKRGDAGHHRLFGPYAQDHVPVTEQDEAVGHAVRATYMYAAMTDIAVLTQDEAYNNAAQKIWQNIVDKKIYITGGIGAKHEGESFGKNFELPNLTAYNETCAAIGNVYWNHRLHCQSGDVKFFDVIERTLYNGLISGLSLDGTHFFYPNALESDGKYPSNQGSCIRKSWFDCSCCPTNVIRFIPSVGGLIYSQSDSSIYVNLYAQSEAKVELADNTLSISQRTQYPWNGTVEITVGAENENEATVKLRIPSWARNSVLPGQLYQYKKRQADVTRFLIDGVQIEPKIDDGYFSVKRNWKNGATITLEFPMDVRMVTADSQVADDAGKVALEYGPLVYAIEEIDNPTDFDQITIKPTDVFSVEMESDQLGGVNSINRGSFKAIPYFVWANRGVGKMKVWLNLEQE